MVPKRKLDIDESTNGDVKRKKDDDQDEEETTTVVLTTEGQKGGFKWRSVIKETLKSAPEKAMKLKKLRKQIIKLYQQHDPASELAKDALIALFMENLQSMKKIKVEEKMVLYSKS